MPRDNFLRINSYDGTTATFAHRKYDGINLRVSWRAGQLQALTRTPHDLSQSLRACGWFRQILDRLPKTATVHGELYAPDNKSSQVKSLLVRDPSKLRFAGFAIEHTSIDDLAPLHEVNALLSSWRIESIPYLTNIKVSKYGLGGCGWFDDPAELLLDPLPPNTEGYVLKNGNRSGWYKLKPIKTIDLIVKGYKDGRGKYLGLIGSVVVETTEGVEVARISGMSDEVRLDISESPEEYIGKVCEVQYQYVGDKGRLRHPNFVRWRDDKPATDCSLTQDLDLATFYF